jgi:hypothetical protein
MAFLAQNDLTPKKKSMENICCFKYLLPWNDLAPRKGIAKTMLLQMDTLKLANKSS